MGFAVAGLLWGIGAASIPVIIHLLSREKPQHLLFPSIRFIRRSVKVTATQTRLKHLLLLALRMAALALVAFALASPRLSSGFLGSIASGASDTLILIDDSYTMGYRSSTGTRMDKAITAAQQLIDKLPPGSRVSLFRATAMPEPFTANLPAARSRMTSVGVSEHSADVAHAISEASTFLNLPNNREGANGLLDIVVFTDRIGAWHHQEPLSLGDNTTLHLFDVGEDQNANLFLSPCIIDPVHFNVNASVILSSALTPSGAGNGGEVEAALELDGKTVAKGTFVIGDSVHFKHTFKEAGLVQGAIRIVDSDNLPVDNVVYFSLLLSEQPNILWIAPVQPNGAIDGRTQVAQITFSPYREDRQQWVVTKTLSPEKFAEWPASKLSAFDVVVLFDVPQLSPSSWARLTDFVNYGGGLITYLGPRTDPGHYNEYAAGKCLPVAKVALPRALSDSESHLTLDANEADLFAKLKGPILDLREPGFTTLSEVEKSADARVLASFDPASPWLLEETIGKGRSVLITSGWTPEWNQLYGGGHPELAFTFQHELLKSVKPGGGVLRAVELGDTVTLGSVFNPSVGAELHHPASSTPIKIEESVITQTTASGNYLVTERGKPSERLYGFSANLDTTDSQLLRQSDEQLQRAFTEESWLRVWVAGDSKDLEFNVANARLGTELYPYIMILLLAIVSVESFLANRFYKR